MVKVEFQEDGLDVIFAAKTKIDLDALNYIAAGTEKCFLKVKYLQKDNKHCFKYSSDRQSVLSAYMKVIDFGMFCTLLKDYSYAVTKAKEHRLLLENMKLDTDYIFVENGHFRFVYLTVLEEKMISVKKSLLKMAGQMKKRDSRIADFEKNLKKLKQDEDVWEYCNSFIAKNSNIRRQPLVQTEEGTTLLNQDKGTTLLAQGEDTTLLSQEEGTILLSRSEDTTILNQEEGTTLLSQNEDTTLYSQEGETTVLSSDVSSYVVDFSGYNDAGTYQTTQFLENEFSESETTLFSSQPVDSAVSGMTEGQVNYDENDSLFMIENRTGEKIKINKNVFMLGKDSQNMDYVIFDNSVSRHHATITCEDGAYYIMDNKSTNGTTIEGVTLQPFEKAELYDGSIIMLGNVGFQIKIERK